MKYLPRVISSLCYRSLLPVSTFPAINCVSSNIQFSKTMSSKKLVPADRIKDTEENVWVEFVQLALEHNPVNLGQGFPSFEPPKHITKALSDATQSDNYLLNQYTRGYGHPRLVRILAKLYSKLINRNVDPNTEILVTVGAYQSLYCAVLGNVNPGDEVIIIEPFFDAYESNVLMAGGVPVYVPLRPVHSKLGQTMSSEDWTLDPEELASKFGAKTKAIIVNTPHNPLGKIFQKHELEMIADLAKKWDTLVIMDEVYEWLLFDGNEHIRMATLPGMWDRTITIGSGGKAFSVTGWKVGWTYGPKNLISHSRALHQNCIYTITTPVQEAIAVGFELETERLGQPECYFTVLRKLVESKRNWIVKSLEEAGFNPVVPQSGYFILADFSKIGQKIDFDCGGSKPKDHKFCTWLIKKKKLAAIPPTSFYSKSHKKLGENYIRFCFVKDDDTLLAAEQILHQLKNV